MPNIEFPPAVLKLTKPKVPTIENFLANNKNKQC
jgi:hypothetical protein